MAAVRVRSKLSFEIIVVDDNSPDGTQAVVNKLQHQYGQQRIVRPACRKPFAPCHALAEPRAVRVQVLAARPAKLGLGVHQAAGSAAVHVLWPAA